MATTQELFDILNISSARLSGSNVDITLKDGSHVIKPVTLLSALEKSKVIGITTERNFLNQLVFRALFVDGHTEINVYTQPQKWTDSMTGELYRQMLLTGFTVSVNDSMTNSEILNKSGEATAFFRKVRPDQVASILESQFIVNKIWSQLSPARLDNYKIYVNQVVASKSDSGLTFGTVAKFIDDAIDEVPVLGTIAPVVAVAESLKHPVETAAIAFTAGAISVAAGAGAVVAEPIATAPGLVGPPAELAGTSLIDSVIAGGTAAGEQLVAAAGTTVVATGKNLIEQQIKNLTGGAAAPTGESAGQRAAALPVKENKMAKIILTFAGTFLAAQYLVG